MADNRIHIYCKLCSERITLAKYYVLSGWSLNRDFENTFREFMQKHRQYHEEEVGPFGPIHFSFEFESEVQVMPKMKISLTDEESGRLEKIADSFVKIGAGRLGHFDEVFSELKLVVTKLMVESFKLGESSAIGEEDC